MLVISSQGAFAASRPMRPFGLNGFSSSTLPRLLQTDKEFDREIKKEEAGETSAERRHDKIVQMRDDYEEARNDDSQETGKMYEHLRDSTLDDGRKGGSTEAERKARWGGGH